MAKTLTFGGAHQPTKKKKETNYQVIMFKRQFLLTLEVYTKKGPGVSSISLQISCLSWKKILKQNNIKK